MLYYKPINNDYILINLNDIFLGPEIHSVIINKGSELYDSSWSYSNNLILDNNLLPLNKIDNILNLFNNKTSLYAVKLKRYNNKYEIIDGRHRIACAILFGHTHIPALIIC
jgi:hypothetical protein